MKQQRIYKKIFFAGELILFACLPLAGYGATKEPIATTSSAQDITFNSARIRGRIDPKGATPTTYWFEWGETKDLGRSTSHEVEARLDRFETAQFLTNLNPKTRYYYRLVAETPVGADAGSTLSFTTKKFEDKSNLIKREPQCSDDFDNDNDGLIDLRDPGCKDRNDDRESTQSGFVSPAPPDAAPLVITQAAQIINAQTVVMNARVNLGAAAGTQAWFEWGPTPELGLRTPPRTKGESINFDFSETLSSLITDTQYYYRPIVVNAYGAAQGALGTFFLSAQNAAAAQSRAAMIAADTASNKIKPESGASKESPSASRPEKPAAEAAPLRLQKTITNRSHPNGTDTAIAAGANNVIEIKIRVENNRPELFTDVIIKDWLPPGVEFIAGSAGSIYNQELQNVNWLIPQIKPGSVETIAFTARTEAVKENVLLNAKAASGQLSESNEVMIILNAPPTLIAQNGETDTVPTSAAPVKSIAAAGKATALLSIGKNILPETITGWAILATLVFLFLVGTRFIYSIFKRRGDSEIVPEISDEELADFADLPSGPTLIRPPGT